jgi:hypothetical protein
MEMSRICKSLVGWLSCRSDPERFSRAVWSVPRVCGCARLYSFIIARGELGVVRRHIETVMAEDLTRIKLGQKVA